MLLRIAIAALGAIAALTIGAGAAIAQNSDKEKAKRYVTDGLAAQDEGLYDDAIALYNQAYELVPHPEILFNLGQAYRLKGDKPTAIRYYRKYLSVDAKGRVAKNAKAWVDKLEKELAAAEARVLKAARLAEEARRAKAARKVEAARLAEAARQAEAVRKAEAARDATALTDPEPAGDDGAIDEPAPGKPGRVMRIAGIASGAVGLVLTGVGIKFGLDARSISNDFSGHEGAWTDELLARQAKGERAETRMFVFTGIGAAAMVAGGVLYFLGSRGGESSSGATAVTPVIGSGSAAFAVTGTF